VKNAQFKTFSSIFLKVVIFILISSILLTPLAYASSSSEEASSHGDEVALVFLDIAIILLAAKFAGLVERYGQPAVLGELVLGMILGNLTLVGIGFFDLVKQNEIIRFLAELGVVVLLFQIGLESKLSEMTKVGGRALMVATVGVVLPFALGTYIVGPFLMPGLANETYLFLGAALTATSVGITARVFQDLGKLQSAEAKIVLGAAVIDDVLGLIVLAVVSALVTQGTVDVATIGFIVLKAVVFLGGTVGLGWIATPYISQLVSRINAGIGMKFSLAIGLCLIFAYLAQLIGLAPIVGAFAAGLILEPVHFRYFKDNELIADLKELADHYRLEERKPINDIIKRHSDHQIDELLQTISLFLVPIFFLVTGMDVDLSTLSNPNVVLVALGLSVAAFIGKYLAGFLAGPVNKHIVGWGMVPRGEVGLIFAAAGKQLGVVNDEVFSVIVIMVVLTTLVTPPMLNYLLKKQVNTPTPGIAST